MANPTSPNPKLTTLLATVTAYRNSDISHDELGTVSGFQEAQTLKADLADYFIRILSALLEVIDRADQVLIDHVYECISGEGRYLGQIEEEIERLAKEGVHTEQFPGARTSQIEVLRERSKSAKLTLQPIEGLIRSMQLQKWLEAGQLGEVEVAAQEKVRELEKVLGEASKALANLQTNVMEKSVAKARSTFDALAAHHRSVAFAWFGTFVAAAGVTVWAVLHVALSTTYPTGVAEAIITIFRRLLLVSVPAVFMRIALGKFNLETNLRILYAHREAVLTQYRTFEAAIGDDAGAKNQFRLEIAKYVFSDPLTGYVSSDAGAEININPVIGMLDKIMPGK
jgi:hypothetical protein